MKLSRALDLFRNRLTSSRQPRSSRRRRLRSHNAPAVSHCELLQTRILPVVTTFVDGVLTIEFDEATESEVVVESSPDLQFGIHVNGQLLDLDSGPMIAPRANDIVELVIRPASQFSSEDASLGSTRIDVFHLLTTEFTNLSVVSIDSGFGDDEVTGSRFADRIVGGPGNDTVIGQHGNDTINGGAGNDSLDGTRGHDVLIGGSGDDQITGGLDNDTITGGNGADILAGDAGNDVLDGGNHADQMNGGDGNDVLRGRGGLDTLRGGAGNDRLYGNGSRNALFGDAGHDTVIGGPARDRLRGGPGNDILLGFGGRDHLLGNAGDDLANGGDDHDTVRGGEGNDFVYGQRGSDFLTGDAGNDLVDGGVGDDLLNGGSGADTLNAGAGNDAITSGEDAGIADIIDGGDGMDSLLDDSGTDDVVSNVESEVGSGEAIDRPLDNTLAVSDFNYDLTTGVGETDGSSQDAHSVIRLDEFEISPEFLGIDGVLPSETYSIAIIDTGIDVSHPVFGPDLTGPGGVPDGIVDRIVYQYDFADGDTDATDLAGHGTFVSSIAAGNAGSFKGVAPHVNVIALKVFPDSGGGADQADTQAALQWVINNRDSYNIVSVNMSLGSGNYSELSAGTTLFSQELTDLSDDGVIVVSASGNSFSHLQSEPGVSNISAHPDTISVGSVYEADFGNEVIASAATNEPTTGEDRITAFTQRASGLLDILAPGGSADGAVPGGQFAVAGGTSFASPVVAGSVPLIQEVAVRELGRRLTPKEFKELVRSTGEQIFDGDDEDDNVDNTNRWYRRLDMVTLGQAVIAMGANDPTGGISNAIGPGAYQNDGVADEYAIRRQVSTVTVDVDGIPTEFLSPADLEIVLSTTDAQSNPVETVIWRQLIDEMNDTEFDENNVPIDIPVELRLAGSSDDDLIVLDFSDGDGGQVLPAGGNFDLVGGLTLLAGSQTTGDSIEIRRGDAPNPAGGFDDAVTEVTHSFDQEGVPLVTISSTLTASVEAVTTSISVADGSVFAVDQTIRIDAEEMLIESISGGTLTVTRGHNGTPAVSHVMGEVLTVLVGHTVNQVGIKSEEVISAAGSTLTAEIDSMTTTISVADGTAFRVFQVLAIENEDVLVTAVNGNVLTVERGVRGTVAAAHVAGVGVNTVARQKEVLISYEGADTNNGIVDRLSTSHRVFQYGQFDDQVRIKDGLFGNDTYMRVETVVGGGNESPIGTPVAFVVPSVELRVRGGDGNDNMIMLEDDPFFNASLVMEGEGGDDRLDSVPYSGNVTVLGGDGDDLLATDGGDDRLDGGDGRDTVRGGGGSDTLTGGPGDDLIRGQGGTDILVEEGDSNWTVININDQKAKIVSSFGTDTLHSNSTTDNIENIVLLGGESPNVLDVSGYSGRMVNGVSQSYIARLYGRAGNDTLTGSDFNDFLFGEEGDDVIVGNDGDDRISGGDGNDHITGSSGEDTMIGLAGNDKFFGGGDNDLILGSSGDDTLRGNSHADRMAGRGNVIGSAGIADTGNTGAEAGDILYLDSGDELVEAMTYTFQWLNA